MKFIGRGIITALFGMALLSPLVGSESQALSTESHSGPVDVRVELSPEAPLMGDPLLLKVEVRADQGIEVLMPEFGEALDRFRIINFSPREEIDDGRTLYSQHYTLQAPVSGSHTIPSILIEFVDMRTGRSAAPDDQDDNVVAQLMVDLAPHVEDFVARLFAIEAEVQALAATHPPL